MKRFAKGVIMLCLCMVIAFQFQGCGHGCR